ncbi:hypothetical protein Tco_0662168 [Tanacetum coccineum]
MTNLSNMLTKFVNSNTASTSGSGYSLVIPLLTYEGRFKRYTKPSGVPIQGPTIPTTSSPPKVVEHETEVIKDTVPPTNNGSTKDVPTTSVDNSISCTKILKPVVATR